ncbi:hypothetical protein DCMF_08380 [Candidatus Formimonas warabiya]|uniref:Tetratricopeptide repeat protein n=2 Tax=Formimonas warabiya TaxID=1761012 RepID=A0A3G1KQS6_FORW1|nr:hypothetical protein DCMF_08380 [Candidatus Formimonas warabiya]
MSNLESIELQRNQLLDNFHDTDSSEKDGAEKKTPFKKTESFWEKLWSSKRGKVLFAFIIILAGAAVLGLFPIIHAKIQALGLEEIRKAFITAEESGRNYSRGLAAFQEKKWSEAISSFQSVIEKDAHYPDAQEKLQLALLFKASAANYEKGEKAAADKDWQGAEKYFREVSAKDIHYAAAQNRLQTVQLMIASAENFARGLEMYQARNLDGAQILLEQVDPNDQHYPEAQETLREIGQLRVAAYLSSARTRMAAGDFSGARADLREADYYQPGSSSVESLGEEIDALEQAWVIESSKEEATVFSYADLKENADYLAGAKIKLRGRVAEVNGAYSVMLVDMTCKNNVWRDRVAVFYYGADEISPKDVITIWGKVRGSFEYPSEAGPAVTMPSIGAEYVE